jgi:hypothetical protein
MAAFNSVTLTETFQSSWSASAAAVSSALPFQANANTGAFTFKISYTVGGGAAQINEIANNILSIAASGNATLNLQSLTDVLGTTGVVLVRAKAWNFVLLSAAQDATNGTACSSVTVQGGASNPNVLSLGGTSPTYTINNGGCWKHGDGGASGITVNTGLLNVKVVNNDASNAAAVFYEIAGATV